MQIKIMRADEEPIKGVWIDKFMNTPIKGVLPKSQHPYMDIGRVMTIADFVDNIDLLTEQKNVGKTKVKNWWGRIFSFIFEELTEEEQALYLEALQIVNDGMLVYEEIEKKDRKVSDLRVKA